MADLLGGNDPAQYQELKPLEVNQPMSEFLQKEQATLERKQERDDAEKQRIESENRKFLTEPYKPVDLLHQEEYGNLVNDYQQTAVKYYGMRNELGKPFNVAAPTTPKEQAAFLDLNKKEQIIQQYYEGAQEDQKLLGAARQHYDALKAQQLMSPQEIADKDAAFKGYEDAFTQGKSSGGLTGGLAAAHNYLLNNQAKLFSAPQAPTDSLSYIDKAVKSLTPKDVYDSKSQNYVKRYDPNEVQAVVNAAFGNPKIATDAMVKYNAQPPEYKTQINAMAAAKFLPDGVTPNYTHDPARFFMAMPHLGVGLSPMNIQEKNTEIKVAHQATYAKSVENQATKLADSETTYDITPEGGVSSSLKGKEATIDDKSGIVVFEKDDRGRVIGTKPLKDATITQWDGTNFFVTSKGKKYQVNMVNPDNIAILSKYHFRNPDGTELKLKALTAAPVAPTTNVDDDFLKQIGATKRATK